MNSMVATASENPIVWMQATKTRDWGGNEWCRVDWHLDHPWEEGRRDTQRFIGTYPVNVFAWSEKQLNTFFDEVAMQAKRSPMSNPYFTDKMPDFKEKVIQAIKSAGEACRW